jgi:glycogen synthase
MPGEVTMRKLKILQCLAFYLPIRIGGIEVYVRALNRELRAKGHDVKVVVPAYPGEAEYPAAYDDIPILTYHVYESPCRPCLSDR